MTSVAERFGAEPASSVDGLLAAGIDGVVIAAATDVHPELLLACLRAGLPTFCEKPVLKDPGDSAEILLRTQQSGVPVQIGYPRRFDAAFAEARRAVATGQLGFLHTVRSTTLDPAPPPDGYVKASGGIFRDCSVHDFDAVRYVTGQEVVEANRGGLQPGGRRVRGEQRRGQRRNPAHPGGRRARGRVELPLQRSRLRRQAGVARLPGQHRSRLGAESGRFGPPSRLSLSRPRRRTRSSWTGSPMRSGPSWPRSPTSSPARSPVRAPWPTPSRLDGSPRLPPCPGSSTARSRRLNPYADDRRMSRAPQFLAACWTPGGTSCPSGGSPPVRSTS